MKQYETFEIRLAGPVPEKGTDLAGIDLAASFSCGGEVRKVRGFCDGNGRYVVRFLPCRAGEYVWKISGVVSAEGKEYCEPADSARGPVRAVGTHFEYDDGTLFMPFGTTVYPHLTPVKPAVLEKLRNSIAHVFAFLHSKMLCGTFSSVMKLSYAAS